MILCNFLKNWTITWYNLLKFTSNTLRFHFIAVFNAVIDMIFSENILLMNVNIQTQGFCHSMTNEREN